MELTFIQLSGFASNWKRMKLTDDDLRALEREMMERPDGPPVMGGTGGLRKIRFALSRRAGGKSGGARVCYAYFAEFALIYLCAVYPKNEKANLTQAERSAFRKLLEAFRRYLHENSGKGMTP